MSSDTTRCARSGRRAMRHNPAAGAVVIMLRSLKMHGKAKAVGELTEQGSPAFEAALPILSQLLKAETADREVRSTAYQLKAARFPNYRDLAGFDFASSEVNEALTRQLHRCEWHCQSKIYTAFWQLRGGWVATVFADESRTARPRFVAKNRLYL